jgi:uncharacterized protein
VQDRDGPLALAHLADEPHAGSVNKSTSPTISMMTTADAISMLQANDVGRLSLDVDGYPVALPVNYAVDGRSSGRRIVVRTAPRGTIGSYQGLASLEVDSFDPRDGLAWSVVVRGELSRLHGPKPEPGPDPFVSDGRTRWMQLTIHEVDGRRFAGDWAGRRRAVNPGRDASEPDAWFERAVTTAGRAMRERVARLRAALAPRDSTE